MLKGREKKNRIKRQKILCEEFSSFESKFYLNLLCISFICIHLLSIYAISLIVKLPFSEISALTHEKVIKNQIASQILLWFGWICQYACHETIAQVRVVQSKIAKSKS
jgi:hypothetical protein